METASPGQRLSAEESGRAAAGDLFFLFFLGFFLSFKEISLKKKKAALIRNLSGQNGITPELGVAKSSSLLGTQRLLLILSLYHHIYPSI